MLRFTEKKIITKEISVNCINSRSFKSREINEENLLLEKLQKINAMAIGLRKSLTNTTN